MNQAKGKITKALERRKKKDKKQHQKRSLSTSLAKLWRIVSNIRNPLCWGLVKTTEQAIYNKIRNRLKTLLQQGASPIKYLKKSKFVQEFELTGNAIKCMYLIQGYRAAAYLTKDTETCLKEIEALAEKLNELDLKGGRNIVEAYIMYVSFLWYLQSGKIVEAYTCLEHAIFLIQSEAPSTFTARIYDGQAQMHDQWGICNPKARAECQVKAAHSYRCALGDIFSQETNEPIPWNVFIWYVSDLVYILLGFPILGNISANKKYGSLLLCGREHSVSKDDYQEALELLSALKLQIPEVSTGWRNTVNERITLCEIYLKVHEAQNNQKAKEYQSAQECLKEASGTLESWEHDYMYDQSSWYNRKPEIHIDLQHLLIELEEDVWGKMHANKLLDTHITHPLDSHVPSNSSGSTDFEKSSSDLSDLSDNNDRNRDLSDSDVAN